MSNVIDIEKRLQLEQKKKAKVDKAKKLEFIRKFLQCKRCLARCSMCGVQFDPQDMYKRHHGSFASAAVVRKNMMNFCGSRKKGRIPPYYWHNEEWLAIWENWLNYQESLQKYTESSEFIELLREVDWQ